MKRFLSILILLLITASLFAQDVRRRPLTNPSGASFPTNNILDNFNRANEGPPLSTSWTTGVDGGANGFSVSSNVAAPAADPSSTYWNVTNFGADCEVYVTMSTFGATRIYWRIQQEGTAGFDGYALLAYSDNNLYVYRVDNGSYTQLGAAIAQTFASGDSIGVSMVGSTITVYYCASGGSCGVSGAGWTSKGTRSDATYGSAGKVGMQTFDSTGTRLDNFGGGSL